MPLNDNIVLRLAYEVLHGTSSSDEALLQLAKPDALNGLDESTIQFNDEIADAAWRELPDLAYALATINLAAARKLGGRSYKAGALCGWGCSPEDGIGSMRRCLYWKRRPICAEREAIAKVK